MKKFLTIDCGEILLREYTIDDVDPIVEITSQPEVYTFLPDFRTTREQRLDWLINYEIPANQSFLKAIPVIDDQIYLRLGIIMKETDQLIGFCMTGLKEELPPPNREIVYAISKHFRNKGYTTEAARGLINFLFRNTNVEILNAVALTDNIGSNRVIQKCGFKQVDRIEIKNQSYYHYQIRKNDWLEKETIFVWNSIK